MTTATYTLADKVDLGSVYTCRLKGAFEAEITDGRNIFDATDGVFDTRTGQFDGDDLATIDVRFECRTTADDPAGGSPVWSAWQAVTLADVTARGFEFRLVAESSNSAHSVSISNVQITVDMPDVTVTDMITVSTGGTSVNFTESFYSIPTVGLTLQNGASGDYIALSGITSTGFDVTVYDSTDSAVERSVSYIVKGY